MQYEVDEKGYPEFYLIVPRPTTPPPPLPIKHFIFTEKNTNELWPRKWGSPQWTFLAHYRFVWFCLLFYQSYARMHEAIEKKNEYKYVCTFNKLEHGIGKWIFRLPTSTVSSIFPWHRTICICIYICIVVVHGVLEFHKTSKIQTQAPIHNCRLMEEHITCRLSLHLYYCLSHYTEGPNILLIDF